MSDLTRDMTVDVPCAHCGHEMTESISRLKDDPVLICPKCGGSTKIESGGTTRQVADQLDDIDRAFDRLLKG